jgi:hypothetical protein
MSEAERCYVIVRADISAEQAAIAAIDAYTSTSDSQSDAISQANFRMRSVLVPGEAAMRELLAEAVVENEHVCVGSQSDFEGPSIALIGPTECPGPLLAKWLEAANA